MKNYIYYCGEDYEISDKAKNLIEGLKKDYKVKLFIYDLGMPFTHLVIELEKNEERYKITIYDIIKEDSLILRKCEAIHIEEKYKRDGYFVFSKITNSGFELEYTSDNEDDNSTVVEQVKFVKDYFPQYLKNNFGDLKWHSKIDNK